VLGNHDSQWDPLIVGVAALPRRAVHALAVSGLWDNRLVGWVLDGMMQIPLDRGKGDVGALQAAIDVLNDGGCIGLFPEGTVSRGRELRARSGAGRLALGAPDTQIVAAAVTGAVDIARFPKRPRLRIEFFPPEQGSRLPGESAAELSARVLAEIRAIAPIARAGRAIDAHSNAQTTEPKVSR
jgi:1-acyl-sn-glycerol-3-phosphate acyltransferase